jgi:hypothetical protein
MTNTCGFLCGTYDEKKAKLAECSKEFLENVILDAEYNEFIRRNCDDKENHEKLIPYMGWFWRHVTFSNPTRIPIGRCDDYIGFMENNKWDYPERYLTEEESRQIISFLDEAIAVSQRGGELSQIMSDKKKVLQSLHDYMQTLEV